MQSSVSKMTQRIAAILGPCRPSVFLYGSVTLDDFRLGWSDIDILVLTRSSVSQAQAEQLLYLRQTMLEEDSENPYYRSFEGGILSLEAFLAGRPDRVVYWGTTGERMTSHYGFDSFCRRELLDTGILLYGDDIREQLSFPTYGDLKADVLRHYESIRAYARRTERDLYSYGWLLDISRCIYTLRTGNIIAKTAAGEWALQEDICPCPEALAGAVQIRKKPLKYKSDPEVLDYAETLGDAVQGYADVLAQELKKRSDLEDVSFLPEASGIQF